MRKLLSILNHAEELIVIVCMFGITVVTFVAVLARYVFNFSVSGADELATYMFLWAALFGAAAGFRYDKHGSVPIIVNLLPARAQHRVNRVVLLVIAVFFGFLAWYALLFVLQAYRVKQISPATGIPIWIVDSGIFAALVMCGLRCLWAVVRDLRGLRQFPEIPVAPE